MGDTTKNTMVMEFEAKTTKVLAELKAMQAQIKALSNSFLEAAKSPEKLGNASQRIIRDTAQAIAAAEKTVATGLKSIANTAGTAIKATSAEAKKSSKVMDDLAAANARLTKLAEEGIRKQTEAAKDAQVQIDRLIKETERAAIRQTNAAKAQQAQAEKLARTNEIKAASDEKAAKASTYHGRAMSDTAEAFRGFGTILQSQIQNSKMAESVYTKLASKAKDALSESAAFRRALVGMATDGRTTAISFDQMYSNLKKAEGAMQLASRSLKDMGHSSAYIKDFAKSFDLLAASSDFANNKLYRVKDVTVGATQSFVGLSNKVNVLANDYNRLINSSSAYGKQAGDLIRNFHSSGESIDLLRSQLRNLNVDWRESVKEISAWQKASGEAAAASNKNGYAIHDLERQLRKGIITHAEATEAIKAHAKAVSVAAVDTSRFGQFLSGLSSKISGIGSATKQATTMFSSFGHALKSMAAYLPAALVIGGLTSAIVGAIQGVKDFDQSLKSLKAISGGTDAEISLLGKEILHLSDITKYTTTELAKGAIFIAQAGFSAGDALDVLSAAAKGAQGTLEPLATAADLLTTVILSFGQPASQAATIMDQLAVAANKSKLTLEGMKTVFNYIGPVAHTAGVSLKDTLGAVMSLANFGVKMSTIGTGLRQIFLDLEKASEGGKKFASALKAAGLTASDLDLRTKDLGTVFENLDKIIRGDLSTGVALFTQRAGPLATILSKYHEYVREMARATEEFGAAQVMAGTQMEGLDNKIKNLGNQFNNFIIRLSQGGLTDIFGKLLSGLEGIVKGFTFLTDNTLAKAVIMFIAVRASVVGLIAVLSKMSAFTGFSAFLQMITVNYTQYIVAATGAAGASTAFTTSLIRARAAVYGLTSALMLNPIVTWMAALSAIAVVMYESTQWVKRHSMALQENATLTQQSSVTARGLAEQLEKLSQAKNANINTDINYLGVLQKIKDTYPELTSEIENTLGAYNEQAKIMRRVQEEQEKAASAAVQSSMAYSLLEEKLKGLSLGFDMVMTKTKGFALGILGVAYQLIFGKSAVQAYYAVLSASVDRVKAAALGVSNLEEKYKLLHIAQLKAMAQGPGDDANFAKKVLAQIKYLDDLRNAIKGLTEYEKQTYNTLATLDEDWANYYARQSASGRVFVAAKAEELKKGIEAIRAAGVANKQSAKETDDAIAAYTKQKLAETVMERSKAAEEIIKLLDKELKAKMSMLDKESDLVRDSLETEKNVRKAGINKIIGMEEDADRRLDQLDREYAEKEIQRIEEVTAKKEQLITENYEKTKRFIEETGALDDKFNEKKIANLENEKNLSDQKIALWEKQIAAYNNMINKQLTDIEKYKNAAIAAEKAIAQIKKDLAQSEAGVQRMRDDANKLVMNDGEKNAYDMIRQQQILADGYSALYQGNIEDAKSFFSQSQSMIGSLNAYSSSVFEGERVDAKATKELRLKLLDEISAAYKAAADKAEEARRAEAAAAKENAEKVKSAMEATVAAVEALREKLGKEIILNLNTTDAVIKLTDLMTKLGEKHPYIIDIEGRGSAQLPISQKIEALKAEFATFQQYINSITSQFVIQFSAKTIGGEVTTLALALDSIKPALVAFKEYLKTLVNDFVIQFIGADGIEGKAWITIVINRLKVAIEAFSKLCNQTATFIVQFSGFEAIPNLISQMNALFAASNRTATFTINVVRTESGSSSGSSSGSGSVQSSANGGLIRKLEDGGGVPGTGNTDSVPALLMPGEYVVKKSVVSALGTGFFDMINGLKNHSMPSMKGIAQAFAQGGSVNKQSSETFTLNLTAGSAKLPLQVVGNSSSMRQQVKAFEKELGKMRLSHA